MKFRLRIAELNYEFLKFFKVLLNLSPVKLRLILNYREFKSSKIYAGVYLQPLSARLFRGLVEVSSGVLSP